VRWSCRRFAAVIAVSVAATVGASALAPTAGAAPRLEVVAAFYPLAWVAERVGGARVTVHNLTPSGAEPHDLELTPDQRDEIEDADVVLVLGEDFQPAVEEAAEDRDGGTVVLLRRLRSRVRDAAANRGGERDPHVWLDPELMVAIVDEVAAAFVDADPRGAARYTARAATVTDQLRALDERYAAGLARCERRLFVTTHESFGYLAAAYDLEQEGVTGRTPDAEPDADRLARLADLAARTGLTTIFTEELVSPGLARTLAREAGGLRVETLNPLEGLTRRELAAGDDYLTVMDRNLARLRRALGCS